MIPKPTNHWWIGLILGFALLGSFAKIMISLDHNEHMYVTAAVLSMQGAELYRDFAYLQTPYLPQFYSTVFEALNLESHYLLTTKFISFMALVASALLLARITRHVTKDGILGLTFAALCLLNPTVVRASTEASNYVLTQALVLAAYLLILKSLDGRTTSRLHLIAGLILGIAIGTRLTHLTIAAAFLGMAAIHAGAEGANGWCLKKRVIALVPLSVGLGAGLMPILSFSSAEAFFFDNLGYHYLTTHWRQINGHSGAMDLPAKVEYAAGLLGHSENLVLMAGLSLASIWGVQRPGSEERTRPQKPTRMLLPLSVLLMALVAALSPSPSYDQYYALPIVLGYVLLGHCLGSQEKAPSIQKHALAAIMLFLSLASNGPATLQTLGKIFDRAHWTGLWTHDVAQALRKIIEERPHGEPRRVATLSPLFAIEAGLPIYPQLATGPFLYRIGDLLTEDERHRYVATSPQTISRLLAADPPAAILVGLEGKLDDPFIAFARANGYSRAAIAGFPGAAYIRP